MIVHCQYVDLDTNKVQSNGDYRLRMGPSDGCEPWVWDTLSDRNQISHFFSKLSNVTTNVEEQEI